MPKIFYTFNRRRGHVIGPHRIHIHAIDESHRCDAAVIFGESYHVLVFADTSAHLCVRAECNGLQVNYFTYSIYLEINKCELASQPRNDRNIIEIN